MLWDTWFIIRGPVDPDLRAIEKSAEMELFGHFVATYSTRRAGVLVTLFEIYDSNKAFAKQI